MRENSILGPRNFLKASPEDFLESSVNSDDRCRHLVCMYVHLMYCTKADALRHARTSTLLSLCSVKTSYGSFFSNHVPCEMHPGIHSLRVQWHPGHLTFCQIKTHTSICWLQSPPPCLSGFLGSCGAWTAEAAPSCGLPEWLDSMFPGCNRTLGSS